MFLLQKDIFDQVNNAFFMQKHESVLNEQRTDIRYKKRPRHNVTLKMATFCEAPVDDDDSLSRFVAACRSTSCRSSFLEWHLISVPTLTANTIRRLEGPYYPAQAYAEILHAVEGRVEKIYTVSPSSETLSSRTIEKMLVLERNGIPVARGRGLLLIEAALRGNHPHFVRFVAERSSSLNLNMEQSIRCMNLVVKHADYFTALEFFKLYGKHMTVDVPIQASTTFMTPLMIFSNSFTMVNYTESQRCHMVQVLVQLGATPFGATPSSLIAMTKPETKRSGISKELYDFLKEAEARLDAELDKIQQAKAEEEMIDKGFEIIELTKEEGFEMVDVC